MDGKATLTIATLTTGSHALTASYGGTTTLLGSTSAPVNLLVDPRVGPEFRVNTYTVGSQQLPAVAPLANGAFVVAWASKGQDSSGFGIYARHLRAALTAAGLRAGTEFRVNATTENDPGYVKMPWQKH